jgi:hypothetical protein
MKRPFRAAWCAALFALSVMAAPVLTRPASADFPPPAQIPNFIRPELFRGFEPFPPDAFGLSPRLKFFVFQDERGLHVIRLWDEEEVFSADSPFERFEVGFDLKDDHLFLLENPNTSPRLRIVDLCTGDPVYDQRFRVRPEIRTDFDGDVIVIVVRDLGRTSVTVLGKHGRSAARRHFSESVQWGINLRVPVVAFVDRNTLGGARIETINTLRGRTTFRETVRDSFDAGFEPFGSAFVVIRRTGQDAFRVRMVNSFKGRFLVNRSFFGPGRAGFTPDSSFLGVESRAGFTDRLYLFSTDTGRQLVLR